MTPLKPGGKIRILQDGLTCARVEAGDILTVREVYSDWDEFVTTGSPRLNHFPSEGWWFHLSDEGTGWERVDGDDA